MERRRVTASTLRPKKVQEEEEEEEADFWYRMESFYSQLNNMILIKDYWDIWNSNSNIQYLILSIS